MRAYEKDEEIKIPDWYMKLPMNLLEKISGIIMIVTRIFPSKKKEKQTGKIKFYID